MRTWMLPAFVVAVLACGDGGQAQERQLQETQPQRRQPPKPPTLQNRAAFIAQRDALGARLMKPGDSVTIKVFVLIDSVGRVHQPEVRQEVDQQLIDAAIGLVRKMQFNPALDGGKPTAVLLTIPVRFRNDGQ